MKYSFIITLTLHLFSFGYGQSWYGYTGDFHNTLLVRDMTVFQDELIIAAGMDSVNDFSVVGAVKWDGTKFDTVSNRLKNSIYSLSTGSSSLLIGGSFGDIGSTFTSKVILWDGASFSTVGSSSHGYLFTVFASAVDPVLINDSICYITGNFLGVSTASGAREIVMYDPSTGWNDMDGGLNPGGFSFGALAMYNGDLIAGGLFCCGVGNATDAYHIARWDGSEWSALKGGLDYNVIDMVSDTMNNFLYVAGGFSSADGLNTGSLARWDGYNWTDVGGVFDGWIADHGMCMYRNELFISGVPQTTGGRLGENIAKWDGIQWDGLNGGINNPAQRMTVYMDTLWMGGALDTVGIGAQDLPSFRLAKWHMPANTHCNWLQSMVYVNDTNSIYQNDTVSLYNNNAYAQNWNWSIDGTSTYSNYAPTHAFTDTGWHDVQVIVTQDGCIDTALVSVYVEEPVGIAQPEQIEFKVYPNPSSGQFTLELQDYQNIHVTVRDLQGKLVLTHSLGSDKTLVNTSNWAKGTYLLELVRDSKPIGSQKLILE
ncbi:MAG: hypothetical protein ACI9J3_001388 [Parvicellaceae bacterium]